MPSKPFNDLLVDPLFEELNPDEQLSIVDKYWDAFKTERPENAEFADAQRGAAKAMLTIYKQAETATEAEKRLLRPIQHQLIDSIDIGNDRAWGRIDEPEFNRRVSESKAKQAELDKDANNLRAWLAPDAQESMAPILSKMDELATNSNKFGNAGLLLKSVDLTSGAPEKAGLQYDLLKDQITKDFGLTGPEVDDVIKHRLELFDGPVSRDALGMTHIREEVMAKPLPEIEKAVAESSLPDPIKKKTLAELPDRVSRFKTGVVSNVLQNHKELAGTLEVDPKDVDGSYAKISSVLNKSRMEQFGGGLKAYGAGSLLAKMGAAPVVQPGVAPSMDELGQMRSRMDTLDATSKEQESINTLSNQFNRDKTSIWGTDAATVGQGAGSAVESVIIAAATGGLGNAVMSNTKAVVMATRYGRLGEYAAKGIRSAADIAPLSVIYGTQQGAQTFEDAMKKGMDFGDALKLGALSAVFEGGITMLASGLGAGGTERTVAELMEGSGKAAVKRSLIGAWAAAGGKAVTGIASEVMEESAITFMDSLFVQSRINPKMTINDIGKAVTDTVVSTIISSGPLSVISGAKELRDSQPTTPTHELDDAELQARADAALLPNIAPEKELPQGTTPAGTNKDAGAPPVAGTTAAQVEMTPEEFTAAKEERLAELRAVENPTPDEAAELKLLDTGTDEQIATELGVAVVKPQETPAPAAAQPTETLPAGPAVTPGGVAAPTINVAETPQTSETKPPLQEALVTGEKQAETQAEGQGRTGVLTENKLEVGKPVSVNPAEVPVGTVVSAETRLGQPRENVTWDGKSWRAEDGTSVSVRGAPNEVVSIPATSTASIVTPQVGEQVVIQNELDDGSETVTVKKINSNGTFDVVAKDGSMYPSIPTSRIVSKPASKAVTEPARTVTKATPASETVTTPTKEAGEYSAAARAVDEDPSPENVARFMLAAMGLKPVDKAPVAVDEEEVQDDEEVQVEGAAETVSEPTVTAVEELASEEDLAEIAAELDEPAWNNTARRKFSARYADWLVTGKEISAKLRKWFKQIVAVLSLSGAVAFSLKANLTTQHAVVIPVSVEDLQPVLPEISDKAQTASSGVSFSADDTVVSNYSNTLTPTDDTVGFIGSNTLPTPVPPKIPSAADQRMSPAARAAYRQLVPAVSDDLRRDGKFLVMADKPSATIFVFTAAGELVLQQKMLVGKTVGDFGREGPKTDRNKITPAGLFRLGLRDASRGGSEAKTAGEYDFGKVYVLDNAIDGEYSSTILHSVWTGESDASERLAALSDRESETSRFSFGCINVDKETFRTLTTNYSGQMDGARIFIVPDQQDNVDNFLYGDAARNQGKRDYLTRDSIPPPLPAQLATTQTRLKRGRMRRRDTDTNNSPAVGRYLRTVPEPSESTVSLLNTVVDELPLNDTELNQNRTQQRITKLVRDEMKKHTKPQGKGDSFRLVVKLGSIKMNELMGKVWKMKNRVLPGWKNFRSAEAVLQRAKIIAYEIASSISKTGSGNDWYSGKINEMYQKLSRFYPELREPGQDRFIFSTILAITSNGENVFSNMVHTINLYNKVRGQGRMPNESDATGEARRETAMFKGFATVQRLIDEGGWQKVDSEFRQNVPYRDMKKRYKIEGKEEKQEQLVSNAYVLGSKIGAFWGNLNGNFGHIAMDLWFTRTMARLSGDFKTVKPTNLLNIQKHFRMLTQMDNVPDDVKSELRHFLNAIPKLDEAPNWTSVPEEVRAQIPLAHKWIKDSYITLSKRKNPETGKGFFKATSEESSAKIVHILLDQANRAPDDAEHRNWMRRVMNTAQKHLKANGIDMSLAEMQAVMWFYEKDLYTKFGATSKRGERADFSEAADYGLARVRQEAFVGDAGPRQDELVQGTLFQNEEAPKGSYLPAAKNAGKAILDLATGKADQTTGLHEAAHTTFDFMDQAKLLTENESKAVKDWASNGTGKMDVAAWEKFARGWERFVLDGVNTGIEAVDKVFAKIASYIANVYKNVTGSSIDIEIPENIREIFNKMAAAGYNREQQGKAATAVPVEIKAQAKPAAKPANKTAGKATKKLPKFRPTPSTAIYNAAVDAELVRNGMTPILKEAAVALQDTWDDSLARMANNPDAGRQLVAELLSRPRVASDIEHGLLLQEFAAQKVAVARARNNMMKEPGEGARRVLEEAMDYLYKVAHASKLAGAEWGRAGRFRQIRIAEDYSIESMQTRYMAEVKGGESLTPAESKKIAELSEKLREMEKEEESLVSRLRDAERALEEAALVEHIEKQAKREKTPPSEQKRATVAKKITDRVSSARDRLAKMGFGGRLQQSQEPTLLYQKPEPESLDPQVLSDLADVGVEYLNNGDATIGKFTDTLVSEFGDAIKPHAKQILAEARKRFKSVAATTKGPRSVEQLLADVDSEAPKLTRELVYNMARAVHMQGYRKEEILDHVSELLQDEFPDVTRAEVAEAFTGYGKVKFPSKEQINIDLRELRNAERIALQIEDVEAGQAPKKTGTQRDKVTVWVREKAALLKAAMKKAGMESIPGADRLKGTLDSIKSNYKNRIEELEIAIRNRQKLPPETHGVTYDEEATQLKEKAAKLREEYDAIFGEDKDLTEEQRIKRAIDSLSRRIKEEKDMRAANQVRRPAGKPAPNSPATQILREELAALVKTRHEAAKALVDSRTPEQRALDRAVTSVENAIVDNELLLAVGLFPSPKAGAPAYTPSQWLQTQRARLKELQKQVAKLRRSKLPRLSTEEKERRRAISYYTRAIANLQAVVNAGVVVARTRPDSSAYDPAVSLLKRENARLRATVQKMREDAKPKLTDDQKALLRDKAAIRRRITALEKKLAAGDYTRPVKRPAGPGDKELADLRLRKDKLLEQWNEEFVKAEFARKSIFDKSTIYAQEVVNVSRALITSFDLSAVGRQGAFIAFGRPVMAAKAIPTTLAAAFSANRMQRLSEEIQNHPTYALSQQAGLFLADNGPNNLTKQEEAFRSRLSRKAPFKYITVPSERAYNAFLNQIRINSFASIIGSMGAGVTVEEAQAVARFVNIATGRGDLGKLEQAAGALSTVFFSPKFVVSRFQLLSGLVTSTVDAATGFKAGDMLGSKGTNRARKAVARQYARSMIGISVCFGLIALAKVGFGDDEDEVTIERDPRSSDFAKIKIGNTRFDFMGGIIQAAVFLSRVSTRTVQKANGTEVDLTEQGWKKDSLSSIIGTFIRTKLAPGVGTTINAWGQKDVFDKPTTASSEIIGSLLPLTFGDIYSSLQEHGFAKGIPLSVLVLFGIGVGVQTYDDRLDLEQQISVMLGLSEKSDYQSGSSDPTKPAY